MTIEFTAWPKTPRLFRDAVITEKIDGTNADVTFQALADDEINPAWAGPDGYPDEFVVLSDGRLARYAAQSRKRLITVGDDNYGFAAYVHEHRQALAHALGEGTHFGEWWGHGIQRGYGLEPGDRRFSLFNVHRYASVTETSSVPGLGVVPVLDRYTFDTSRVADALYNLERTGSHAAPGFDRPEGVIVFHSQSGQVFKALIENDDVSKTEAGVAEVAA